MFNIAYAQYLKGDFDISKSFRFDDRNSLALHFGVGVAYPYGNSTILPYEKRYFSGGANSVRGWSVRELGPGRFTGGDGRIDFINQTGDIKFEANLEYRFPILGDLHGATFLDAGNVWLLRYDKSRPGGQLKWGRFLKDLALGTGIGLRYDLTFLVIRLDWGIGLHVPYDTGKKGYYNIPDFKDGMGVHLAIGYPF